ncbi:pectate lyase a [Xylariaceae sp. FL0016]|nr:pectate lyase a [Xylariaceae sp. FL0016]
MKSIELFTVAAAALLASVSGAVIEKRADAVVGSAEGFAKGVTGGGSATAVYPTTNAQLVSYLGDSSARVIVLTKTFDFTGTEGTTTATGCAPWGTASGCQTAINQNSWCTNYQPDAPSVSVTYDNAAILGITVGSNKSLIGQGTAGVIKGKGLRIVSGASNIIIQNIRITDLNPQYVWGGDAITLDNTDLVWIDHVKTDLIGRQHIVLGNDASNRVTISNNEIDGTTSWSATCDGHHYWGLYFTGSNDLVTLKGNYIHHTSGRSPKVAGNTLLHAVNNYFYASSGHAFEIGSGAMILAEGNVFQNVPTPAESPVSGKLFTSPDSSTNAACTSYLGHACQLNAFGSSGDFYGVDESFFSYFSGKNVASAVSGQDANSQVVANAGVGKI